MCPWCYTPAFMKPAGHPSSSNQSKLMGTVVADAVGEKILEEMRHDIIPEFQLTVDNLIKVRLKEVTKAVEDQMKMMTEKTRELETLKESYLSTAESRKPEAQKTHKEKLTPVLSENPTENIGEYKENFLSTDEVVNLRHTLDALEFSTVNGREVASFGEEYSYGGAPKNNKNDIPDSFKAIIEKVHSDPNYEGEQLNQIVINKYTGLTHLPEHSDGEPVIRPHSNIFTITIGEKVPIVFKDSITKQEKTLEPIEGSLYVMSMESQYHWTHRMNQANLENMVRYSVTLRSVGKNFKNSTVILGYSNTKHLNFSQGQRHEKGTFGYNLPGERIETFHIRDIDENKCIGFQNVIIHCGVNNIRDNSPGRAPTDPDPTNVEGHFQNIVNKICLIKRLCPYASVVVSPILPTKNTRLNQRVLKFNHLLFNFLANEKQGEGVRTCYLQSFVDEKLGVLKEELSVWDRNAESYNKKDILHLGRSGIRLLANVFCDSILSKLTTSRGYSDALTNHTRGHLSQHSR